MRNTLLMCGLTVCAALAATVILGGCQHKPEGGPQINPPDLDIFDTQLKPGERALRKLDPKEYPDFTPAFTDALANTEGLRRAINFSLDYLAKPSSKNNFPYGEVTHEQAVATLKAFLGMLDGNLSAKQMNDAVQNQFDVYVSKGADRKGRVLFTGYYTPVFDGSLTRTDRFRYPLYKIPAGLSKKPDGTVDAPSRQAIEQQPYPDSDALVWLGDPFEAFVAHVQGSAKIRLTGVAEPITVGYTATNGQEYVSIRNAMAKDGKIGKRDGLRSMITYFKGRPDEVARYTQLNPRYTFFAPVDDGRPRGCLNVPVTQLRSIATDKRGGMIYPPACLALVDAKGLNYNAFVLDQDTGGAIRAAGRCDIYLGVGDRAGEIAGQTMSEGKLYYLFLRQSPPVTSPVLQPPSGMTP